MANKRKMTGKERRQKKLQRSKKERTQPQLNSQSTEEGSLFMTGINAQTNGDNVTAEECYRKVLEHNPEHPRALLQLGTLFYRRNELLLAEEYMQRAHANGLNDESYYINYGLVCDKLRKTDEALECYDKALAITPDVAQCHFNKGLLLYKRFRFAEAYECFKRADELEPNNWLTEFQVGCSLQETKRYDESLAYFEKARQKNPENPRILCGMGMSLIRKYKYQEGLKLVAEAVNKEPENVTFLFNYAFALKENGKKREAKAAFEKALELDPNNLEALLGLGRLLTELGDYDTCRELFQKAIDLKPDYYAAYASMGISYYKSSARKSVEWFDKALEINPEADDVYSLKGYALNILGDTEEAEKAMRRAIELKEDSADYHQNIGNVLVVESKVMEALEHCRRSVELNPNSHLAFSNLLLYMHYIPQSTREDIWKLHQTYSNLFEPKNIELRPYLTEIRKDRKIRIGIVSSDLRKHSVAYFIEPLLSHADKENYDYYCYANVKVPDSFSKRIADMSTKWQSILQLSDVEAAELIRHDKIDILVDLGGHTADNRLKIFCLKPAPIQVSWLGYPDTTGLRAMDYRIADEYTEPEGSERYSSEQIIKLPGGFHCYSAFGDSPDLVPPPSVKNGHITFGSFNNFAKCSAETIFLWSEILKNVPGSKLVLKALSLGDKYVQEYAYSRFESFGIERERITMMPRTMGMKEHFACYNEIDIALDTYPYNGTTTTCEAMWMGVPVVTFYGPNHASRVGLSLLSHVGLPQLAASTPEEYVGKAVALAHEEKIRDDLRRNMRVRLIKSPILNAEHFSRKFEAAMHAVWNVYCDNPTGKHEAVSENKNFTLNFKTTPEINQLQQQPEEQSNKSFSLNFGNSENNSQEIKPDNDDDNEPPASGIKLHF